MMDAACITLVQDQLNIVNSLTTFVELTGILVLQTRKNSGLGNPVNNKFSLGV